MAGPNVKQEKLWGVVLITSDGRPLIWGAQETSSERSRTENVIGHIEQLMDETQKEKLILKHLYQILQGNILLLDKL